MVSTSPRVYPCFRGQVIRQALPKLAADRQRLVFVVLRRRVVLEAPRSCLERLVIRAVVLPNNDDRITATSTVVRSVNAFVRWKSAGTEEYHVVRLRELLQCCSGPHAAKES